MFFLALIFAIGTAFIPMPRILHTLLTVLIVFGAFIAMGVGGCTQYWDDHMRPGVTTGREVVGSAVLVIIARIVAMFLANVRGDAKRTGRSTRFRK